MTAHALFPRRAAATEAPALDCTQPGSFPEAAMLGIGDSTYARADNALDTFTLGPLLDVPGWGGKHAEYTRRDATHDAELTGMITVIMDNPAIGAVITFEDNAKVAKGTYFITASKMSDDGKTSAMCFASPTTGDRFLVTRQ